MPSRHSPGRPHGAFCALPEGIRKGAWEMDAVEGRKGLDRQCLLTLCRRPAGFRLALLLAEKAPACVEAGLGPVSRALGGAGGMRRVSGTVLADSGGELSGEAALAAILGERPGEARLRCCDTMSAWQKGGCERSRSGTRRILPKGEGIMSGRLGEEGCSPLMGEANSEIRGKDGWPCPPHRLLEAFGPDARALLDAFHIELIGPDSIVLEPACLDGLHGREGRPALRQPSGEQRRPPSSAVRMSAGSAPEGPWIMRPQDPSERRGTESAHSYGRKGAVCRQLHPFGWLQESRPSPELYG